MDLKEVLTITIPSVLPTLTVLFGILSNKNDINHVRTEIGSLRGAIASVCNEMAGMRKDFHADIMMLVSISNDPR